MEKKLTKKQQRFCDEYIIDCNATRAYLSAFTSCKNAGSASTLSGRLLEKVEIKAYIDAKLREIHDKSMATADEVISYLTSVVRGQSESEVVVIEGVGDGCSNARNHKKKPTEAERIKAAELLGKYHSLFTDRHKVELEAVQFVDNVPKDD